MIALKPVLLKRKLLDVIFFILFIEGSIRAKISTFCLIMGGTAVILNSSSIQLDRLDLSRGMKAILLLNLAHD